MALSVSPTAVVDITFGLLKFELLKAAIDIKLFDVLAGSQGQGKTSSQLATELGFTDDRAERFFKALVAMGLLELRDYDFHNTAESEMYLTTTSPRSVCDLAAFMRQSSRFFQDDVIACLKGEGHLHVEKYGYDQEKRYKSGGEEYVQLFSRGMAAMAHTDMDCLRHVDFTGCNSIIDLGGNMGWHARAIRRLHPHVNHVIVADLPDVVKVSAEMEENKQAGVEYVTVNFLTDESLPKADAYVLSHLVHDYADAELKTLLTKTHKALNDGGLLVVLEAVMTSDKTGPGPAVFMDQVMLLRTAGRERSADEYERLLADTGFGHFRLTRVEGGALYDVMVAKKL